MSLAVITDSSVNLPAEIQGHADVYVLDIPVIIEGQPFVEGKNLDVNQFCFMRKWQTLRNCSRRRNLI